MKRKTSTVAKIIICPLQSKNTLGWKTDHGKQEDSKEQLP